MSRNAFLGYHPSLRRTALASTYLRRPFLALLQYRGLHPQSHQPECGSVRYPHLQAGHEFVVRDRVEVSLEVRVVYLPTSFFDVLPDFAQCLVCRSFRAESVRTVQEVRFKDWFQDEHGGRLDSLAELHLWVQVRFALFPVSFRIGTFLVQAALSSSCFSMLLAGFLGSTGVTPLLCYYEPLRIPLPPLAVIHFRFTLGSTHDEGLPGSSASLSVRALHNRPGRPRGCSCSLLPLGCQASPSSVSWPPPVSVTRPNRFAFARARTFDFGTVSRPTPGQVDPSRTGPLLPVGCPRRRGRVYVMNEQLSRPVPFNQTGSPGFSWRSEDTKGSGIGAPTRRMVVFLETLSGVFVRGRRVSRAARALGPGPRRCRGRGSPNLRFHRRIRLPQKVPLLGVFVSSCLRVRSRGRARERGHPVRSTAAHGLRGPPTSSRRPFGTTVYADRGLPARSTAAEMLSSPKRSGSGGPSPSKAVIDSTTPRRLPARLGVLCVSREPTRDSSLARTQGKCCGRDARAPCKHCNEVLGKPCPYEVFNTCRFGDGHGH